MHRCADKRIISTLLHGHRERQIWRCYVTSAHYGKREYDTLLFRSVMTQITGKENTISRVWKWQERGIWYTGVSFCHVCKLMSFCHVRKLWERGTWHAVVYICHVCTVYGFGSLQGKYEAFLSYQFFGQAEAACITLAQRRALNIGLSRFDGK